MVVKYSSALPVNGRTEILPVPKDKQDPVSQLGCGDVAGHIYGVTCHRLHMCHRHCNTKPPTIINYNTFQRTYPSCSRSFSSFPHYTTHTRLLLCPRRTAARICLVRITYNPINEQGFLFSMLQRKQGVRSGLVMGRNFQYLYVHIPGREIRFLPTVTEAQETTER